MVAVVVSPYTRIPGGEKVVFKVLEPPYPETRLYRVYEVPGPRPVKPVERSYGVAEREDVYVFMPGKRYLVVEYREELDRTTGKAKRRVVFKVYKNGRWQTFAYIRHSNQLEYIAAALSRLVGDPVAAARILMRAEAFLKTGNIY